MGKENNTNKAGKSSSNIDKTIIEIFVVDLVAVIFIGLAVAFDCTKGHLEKFSIGTLTFDSIVSVLTLVASFLIPRRNEKVLEKYHLSDEQYDSLSKRPNTSGIYINLLVVSLALILADALLFVYEMNWSLIAALIVEIMYICVFIVPTFISYIRGDDEVIRLASNKFSEAFTMNPKFEDIRLPEFTIIEWENPRIDEINELYRVYGNILANNDALTILDKTLEKIPTASEKEKNIATNNICAFFCKSIARYVKDLRLSSEEFVKSNNQILLIIDNIFSLKSKFDVSLSLNDNKTTYDYISDSLLRLGNMASSFDDNSVITRIMNGLEKTTLFDHYHLDSPSSLNFYQLDFSILDYLLIQTINEDESWFLERMSEYLKIPTDNNELNYFVVIVIYLAYYLVLTSGTSKIHSKQVKNVTKIVEEKYSNLFFNFFMQLDTANFKSLYDYLTYSTRFIEGDPVFSNSDLFISVWPEFSTTYVTNFWSILVLFGTASNIDFYDNLYPYLAKYEIDAISNICNIFLNDKTMFKTISNPIIKYGFGGSTGLKDNEINDAVNFILDNENRQEKYKEAINNSNIHNDIDKINTELSRDVDFIDINEIPNKNRNVKQLVVNAVYCLSTDNSSYISKVCNFFNKDEILHQVFENFQSHYIENPSKMNIVNDYDDDALEVVSRFKPDFIFIPDSSSDKFEKSVFKNLTTSLSQSKKYLRYGIHRYTTLYQKGAIRFYIKVSNKDINMRPLTPLELGLLSDYLRDSYPNFNSELYQSQQPLDCLRVLSVHVDYDILLDLDKLLICVL